MGTRRFKGFAVIERRDGPLVWGTFRPSAAEARAIYDRWNPPLPEQPARGVVVTVEITVREEV